MNPFHTLTKSAVARAPRRRCRLRLESLEPRTLMSGGQLDPTFGAGGEARVVFGVEATAAAAALQADGKIVVAGTAAGDFAVARCNADGSRDPSFDGDGRVTTHFDPAYTNFGIQNALASGVAIQPDGKIVVVGSAPDGDGYTQLALVRYQPDGSLDPTFGTGGRVLHNFGPYDSGVAVTLQADGGILVLGNLFDLSGSGHGFLARFTPAGELDRTFGELAPGPGPATRGGTTDVRLLGSSLGFVTDFALQPNPNEPPEIVVVGPALTALGYESVLARFHADGTPDLGFGTGGQMAIPLANFNAAALAVQPDRKLLVAGAGGSPHDFYVARALPEGGLDAGFGANAVPAIPPGVQFLDFAGGEESANDVAVQADGKILAVGQRLFVNEPSLVEDFALARLDATGQPDATFGTDGRATTDFGTAALPTRDEARSVLLQPDGKIVVAGTADGNFALARYFDGEPPDADGDGVPNYLEDLANHGPTPGDGNGDGTPDRNQDRIVSLPDAAGDYLTLEAARAAFRHVDFPDLASATGNASLDSAHLPVGMVSTELTGVSVDLTIYLPAGVTADSFFSFGRTADDPTPHWYKLWSGPAANVITFTVADGGPGDDDLTANGRIVLRGAPATDLATDLSISGLLFHDANANGTWDGPSLGEEPLSGWTVYLDLNGNGTLDRDPATGAPAEPFSVTDAAGSYAFVDDDTLAAGTFTAAASPAGGTLARVNLERRSYRVAEVPQTGWANTSPGESREQVTALDGTPRSAALADVDGDGWLDLVLVVNGGGSGDVQVLLNQHDGTFVRRDALVTGGLPEQAVVADFNGDGLPDLAVTETTNNGVGTFLGNAAGGFDRGPFYAVGQEPLGLVAGLFDADGYLDLAVANYNSGTVSLLRGRGDGTFQAATDTAVGPHPVALAAGKLQPPDDFLDLVVGYGLTGDTSVLYGDGSGSFPTSQTIALAGGGFGVGALALGRLDRTPADGLDLAVAQPDADAVDVLFGFPSGGTPSRVPVGGGPGGVAITDLNGDGTGDLVVAQATSGSLARLTGGATFTALDPLPLQSHPFFVAAGDLDHDGHPDFVTLDRLGQTYSVVLSNPGLAQVVTLGNHPRAQFVNFGNRVRGGAEIRGSVWYDDNGDGVRGPAESGAAGRTVYADLDGDGHWEPFREPSARTDAGGNFVLPNLAPGSYQLGLAMNGSEVQTFPGAAAGVIVVRAGQVRTDVTFGFRSLPGTVRGTVWLDRDGNGVQDAGEPGLAGVTVYLDTDGTEAFDPATEPSRVTDADGRYAFDGLASGHTYTVAEVIPAGMFQTLPGFAGRLAYRQDLAVGATVEADFGNEEGAGRIYGKRFDDLNGDGLAEPGEPALSGETIFADVNRNGLRDPGEPSAVTDAQGDYAIDHLPPGDYAVFDEAAAVVIGSPSAPADDLFGYSLAVGTHQFAVGDPTDDGAVYVFGRGDAALQRELSAPHSGFFATSQGFGLSVALLHTHTDAEVPLQEDFIAVGSRVGPVHQFFADTGTETWPLRYPDSVLSDFIGPATSIAAGGDTYFVGTPDYNHDSTLEAGPGGVQYLTASGIYSDDQVFGRYKSGDPSAGDFGVDFSEAVAVVNSVGPAVSDPALDRVETDFRTFTHPTGQSGVSFGAALASLGPLLLIGAPGDDTGAAQAGAVYAFDAPSGTLRLTLPNPAPQDFDHFGFAVTAVGDQIAVGAPGDDTLGEDAGAVYLFDGATGQLVQTVFSPEPHAGAQFGFSLAALDGSRLLVGAPAQASSSRPGAAYIVPLPRSARVTAAGQSVRVDFPRVEDDDGDGVPNTVEGAAASRDPSFARLVNPFTGTAVTLQVRSPDTTDAYFMGVRPVPNPSPADAPGDFPIGLYAFTVAGLPIGGTAYVSITPPPGSAFPQAAAYYKYGPEPGNAIPHWYAFEGQDPVTHAGAASSSADVFLTLVDGERGDDDLTANGVIVDPGGPSVGRPTAVALTRRTLTVAGAGDAGAARYSLNRDGGVQALTTLANPFPGFTGQVRTAAGDVNGDGVPDTIFAAGPGGGPNVIAVNGRDGTALYNFMAFDIHFTGGVTVAAGDVDGDGCADLVCGAGPGGGPNVVVVSGKTGAVLMDFFAYDAAFTGGVAVAAGDLDGDGKADVVTGAGAGGGPDVGLFLSATSTRRSFFAFAPGFALGLSVAAGDVDGDGTPDVVAGAGAGGAPAVRAISGRDLTGSTLLADFLAYDAAFTGGVSVAVKDVAGTDGRCIVTGAGPGGGPQVRLFRLPAGGPTPDLLDAFFAFDPVLTGGLFIG